MILKMSEELTKKEARRKKSLGELSVVKNARVRSGSVENLSKLELTS